MGERERGNGREREGMGERERERHCVIIYIERDSVLLVFMRLWGMLADRNSNVFHKHMAYDMIMCARV